MPALRQYQTFISHAWRHHDDYYRVEQMLNDAPMFSWNNLSVPRHDPILKLEQLTKELNNQMRPAEIFIILAGMYVAHSEWIQYEINFARRIGRPILGIRPWGSTVVPVVVQNGAHEIIGWNSAAIVSAIRRLAL
jgi:hypothetical protein